MSTCAVAVIDLQKAYFQAGDLQGEESRLVSTANEILGWAREAAIPVYSVVTQHKQDRSTWTLNMLDDNEGYLFEEDIASETLDGLSIEGATTIVKNRDSAFFGTGFAGQLRAASVDTLILLGVSTHSCVYQTASDAYAHNFRVIIAADAVASHDRRWHEPALAMLAQEYRQTILRNTELRRHMQP